MKSNREIELLVEESVGLVHFIIKKYFKYTARKCKELDLYDDLVQEGMIGLYKAAKIFDESKGYQFATIASRCIYGDLYKFQDRYIKKNYRNDISLEKNVGKEGENEITMPIAFEEDGYKYIEYKEIMERLNSHLDDREKSIVKLRLKGLSQEEIGKTINISQVQVSRKLKQIRTKLIEIENKGFIDKTKTIESNTERKLRRLKKSKEVRELFDSGFCYKDISKKLDIPLGSVSSYLRAI